MSSEARRSAAQGTGGEPLEKETQNHRWAITHFVIYSNDLRIERPKPVNGPLFAVWAFSADAYGIKIK